MVDFISIICHFTIKAFRFIKCAHKRVILDSPFSCGVQCIVDPVVKRELHSIALPYTFALQVVYNMTSSTAIDQPSVPEPGPCFFENSCTGLGTFYSESAPEAGLSSTQSSPDALVPASGRNMQKGYLVGEYTCCVPGCYHNSKKDKHLSFYQFPSGARPEKVALKKKWNSLITRQNFTPTSGHRVCSEHFPGGKKTYLNNLPLIVPKGTRPRIPKPRTITKARNRECNDMRHPKETDVENTIGERKRGNEEKKPEEQIIYLRKEIEVLKQKQKLEIKASRSEISLLTREKEAISMISFHIDNIKHDKDKFHFYTGLPDYQTVKILHNSFGTATGKLIYHDSKTNADKITEEGKKSGPKRSLSSEQELFFVLARLPCGTLWTKQCQNVSRKHTQAQESLLMQLKFLLRMPSSLRTQSESYSSYKHHNTAKGLIGIAPSGSGRLKTSLSSPSSAV